MQREESLPKQSYWGGEQSKFVDRKKEEEEERRQRRQWEDSLGRSLH